MFKPLSGLLLAASSLMFLSSASVSQAGEGGSWMQGDWYVTLGASGFVAPPFQGADRRTFQWSPIISVSKGGAAARFSSRNDSASFGLLETNAFRAGITGKLVTPRDGDTADELKGLKEIPWGVELGGFAEVYPTEWLRARAEVRRGIHSHEGVVADLSLDAFADIVPDLQISGGPRMTLATRDYTQAYYGVSTSEAASSGLSAYDPDGGMVSAGVGTALTWKASEQITTSAFAEYRRLTGPAADSSLVRERGSNNQFLVGISASYTFGFNVP